MRSADRVGISGDLALVEAVPSSATPTVDRMSAGQAAGYSVRQTSRRLYGEALLSAVCSVALLAVGLILGDLGAREVGGLFIIVGILLAWDARRRGRAGTRFKVGAIAEERVGSRLWKLEALDWLVEHDVPKGGGGNIDHLVQSPAVTFVIETKAGRDTPRDIAQALRHAEWARRRYGGQRAIVPVLCLQHSKQRPELIDGVYRVGASHLVSFMLDKG
jgi:hypothetical protein